MGLFPVALAGRCSRGVPDTYADVEALRQDVGYASATVVEDGIARFVEWYGEYYQI